MFKYNTASPPIRLSAYGRYTEQLVGKIAMLQDEAKRTTYTRALIPLITLIGNHKKQQCHQRTDYWTEIAIMADYKLTATSLPLPSKKVLTVLPAKLPYRQQKLAFRCCGKHLIALIHKLYEAFQEKSLSQEKLLCSLVKLVQQFHKKQSDLKSTLNHIEEVARKKLPMTYTDIEALFLKHHTQKASRQPLSNNERAHLSRR